MAEQAVLEIAGRVDGRPVLSPRHRIAAMLGELAPARRTAIEPALAALLSAAPPAPRDPAWSALAEGQGHDLLGDFDVTRAQIHQSPGLTIDNSMVPVLFLGGLVHRLLFFGREPIGSAIA